MVRSLLAGRRAGDHFALQAKGAGLTHNLQHHHIKLQPSRAGRVEAASAHNSPRLSGDVLNRKGRLPAKQAAPAAGSSCAALLIEELNPGSP